MAAASLEAHSRVAQGGMWGWAHAVSGGPPRFPLGVEDDSKSGEVRSVPLSDRAAKALGDLSWRAHFAEQDDLVFVNTAGAVVDDSKLRARFDSALERASLERLRFHDVRHGFGTMAVQAFALSDGHADIQTTMVHVHHVPQHDAADRLGAFRAISRRDPPRRSGVGGRRRRSARALSAGREARSPRRSWSAAG
jgi:integrase